MQHQKLAMHESLEIHELLAMKTTCVMKAASFRNAVQCEQLRGLLQQDMTCKTHRWH